MIYFQDVSAIWPSSVELYIYIYIYMSACVCMYKFN